MKKRLLKRGETSGRDDDNIESIRKRFATFKETSMPVVDWFEQRGQLRKVSSVQTVEEVWSATKAAFDQALAAKPDFKVALLFSMPFRCSPFVRAIS